MSDASFEILISAYLDNELGPEQRAQAERLIAESAELAELLETMKSHSSQWKSLSRYKLDAQFASRLMATDAFENAFSAVTLSQSSLPAAVTVPRKSKIWRAAALAIGALAALILVTLTIDPTHVVTSVAVKSLKPNTPPGENVNGVNDSESLNRSQLKGSSQLDADVPDHAGQSALGNPLQRQSESETSQLQSLDTAAAGGVLSGLESAAGAQSKKLFKRDAGVALRAEDELKAANNPEELIDPQDLIVKNSKQPGMREVDSPSIATGVKQKQLLMDKNDGVMNIAAAETASTYFAGMAPIEQVIDITLAQGSESWEHQYAELRTALADNEIVLDNDQSVMPLTEMNRSKSIAGDRAGFGSGNSEVLYIETSPAKMRGLISKLASDNTTVKAYNFSTQDLISPSLRYQPAADQRFDSFDAGKQSQPTRPKPELNRGSGDELGLADQPVAPRPDLAMGQKNTAQQAMPEKRNRRSQVEDPVESQLGVVLDEKAAGGLAGGQSTAAPSETTGSNSDPTRSRSFARLLAEKSEFTFQSTIELEKQMAGESGKTAEGMDRPGVADGQGGRQAAANSRVELDSVKEGSDETGQVRKKSLTESNESELRDIELISRVLGIQPGASGQEQITRRYLLLVRRARQPGNQADSLAPAAADAPVAPGDK